MAQGVIGSVIGGGAGAGGQQTQPKRADSLPEQNMAPKP